MASGGQRCPQRPDRGRRFEERRTRPVAPARGHRSRCMLFALKMRTVTSLWILTLLVFLSATPLFAADPLDDLAMDFWSWRAVEQPLSTDDIPRHQRPRTRTPDWSPEAVTRYRMQLVEFETPWKSIDRSSWPVPRQVDRRLMGSAIARVRWELEVLRNWQRNPMFYVDQTAGAYFQLLLRPPPFDLPRSQLIVATLNS